MNEDQKSLKSNVAETEEKILDFWEKNDIFQKTLKQPSTKGDFVFYDGPPFATGEPHYGHAIPGTIKDIIPRFKTMQGYHVPRVWGWDCHGLPVENIIEKELKLASKKDIIEYGIGKFNYAAQNCVMRYANDWKKIIPRLGRWVDMDNDYKTMDVNYTESVWWAFAELYKKGLIYEGFKSMNLCPRCETTLSNFEVSQGYKDITDISVYVKFKIIKDQKFDDFISDDQTYMLAWTTTPWTLPGNVALAINSNIDYIKIEIENIKLIIAESRLSVLKNEYKILGKINGKDLIGKSYKPIFDYYSEDKNIKNIENGWKIYNADFVNTEDGTGIVHIAPAFGSDDYELSIKYNLPFIQHVSTNGKFKKEVIDFANQDVKPKDTAEDKANKIETHQKTDIEIIKYLAKNETLFAKEKIIHSYPHCWRCDTPLLNYATSSWFVKVTAIRDKLIKKNKKIKWIPKEIGEGRFGNWLSGARDWAISRSRFWGAPLPVWKDEKTDEYKVISSIEDMKKYTKSKNTYYVCRHGEAENNTGMFVSSIVTNPHHLTEKGKVQANEAGKWLSNKKIDIIFSSPFLRTKETAEMIADKIKFDKSKIIYENKLSEINLGIWEGKPINDFFREFNDIDRFLIRPENGENYTEVKKRVGDFIYSIENEYKGKNILIITHDTPVFLLEAVANGFDKRQAIEFRGNNSHYIGNAKPFKLDFHPLPHNSEYEIDLHRPFIDDLELLSEKGNRLKRIPEVFDCWFESGSMPFGSMHYPFIKTNFNPKSGPFTKILGRSKGYPANFIAEGQDQTRGWFYSMLVLGIALFGKSPYQNVVVNGLLLAEDGQKMSKSKKNYPDIMLILNKYGADALRYYLMSSPVVHAQDFCFIEKGVDEIVKKHIGRLNNVVSFYEMYADKNTKSNTSNNPLDLWIIARLAEIRKIITENLEKYEIDKAIRPIADFIDDLSTWYLRRSRDRFKGENKEDKQMALSTTHNILIEFSKLLAPFMPFIAEDIYLKLKNINPNLKESVHLESWPDQKKIDKNIIESMIGLRKVASLGLEARMKVKINVRQPLSKLIIKNSISDNLLFLLKDEVNVKEIIFDANLVENIVLDTFINDELKEEGIVRELIRTIQDFRKEKNLTIQDRVILIIDTNDELLKLIEKNKNTISNTTLLKDIVFRTLNTESVYINNIPIKLDIEI